MSDLPHADEPWANHVPHLLWEVTSQVSALTEAAVAGTALTPAGIGLLDQVATEPGITIAEISRRIPKTPQAISQNAARLEKLGYLERRLAGGRAIGLHVTPAGEAARAAGNAAEAEFDATFRAALGDDRYEQLRGLLQETRRVVAELNAARGREEQHRTSDASRG
jgi:DNA-binding MarR family transcriptional regulator